MNRTLRPKQARSAADAQPLSRRRKRHRLPWHRVHGDTRCRIQGRMRHLTWGAPRPPRAKARRTLDT